VKFVRTIGVLAASVAAAAGLAACASSSSGGSSASGNVTLTLYNDSDVNIAQLWEKTLIPEFEKANPGVTLKFDADTDGTDDSAMFARFAASVKENQSPPMDLIVDASFSANASQAGLLTDVTPADVPNMANIAVVDDGLVGQVAYRGSAVVIAYNSKKVASPPRTLPELLAWIKAHPGQFTYNSPSTGGSGQGFVQAVLDSYLSTATVGKLAASEDTAAQSQWQAGFAELKSLGSDMYQHTYPNGNQAVLNLLGEGQISVAPVWSDMFMQAEQEGSLPSYVKAITITDPALPGGPAYLAVPKNAPDQKTLFKLMNWVLEPAQQATIAEQVSGYPAIAKSELSAKAQSAFGALDPSTESPSYSSDAASDMESAWQKAVP
jgi:putative spermidine/putrescine transport system substrate-binding protein